MQQPEPARQGQRTSHDDDAVVSALRLAAMYALFAVLWLLLSAPLLAWLFPDPAFRMRAAAYQGWFFIGLTSLLLYVLVHRIVRRLLAQKAQLRALLDSIPDPVWRKDGNGVVRDCNQAFARSLGRRPEEILGLTDAAWLPPEQAEYTRALDQQAIAAGCPQTTTEPITHTLLGPRLLQTVRVPLTDDGKAAPGILGIGRDITDLHRQRQLLQTIIEGSPDAMFAKDPQGRYLLCNTAAASFIGRTVDEVIGRDDREIFPEPVGSRIMAWDQRILAGLEPGKIHEAELINPVGRQGTFLVTKGPILDDVGAITGVFGISRDITDRALIIKELRHLNRTLQALSHSNQILLHASDETTLLDEVCRIVVEDCGYAMVWIGLAEHDETRGIRPVAQAGFAPGYLESLDLSWAEEHHERCPSGRAIHSGRPVLCRDMQNIPDMGSVLVLPLVTAGTPCGALTICAREPDAFPEEEVALLTELANDLSFGLHATRLRAEHSRTTEALRHSESSLRSVLQAAPVGIAVTMDRIILQANFTLSVITGYPQNRLVGQPSRLLYADEAEYERVGREKDAQLRTRGMGVIETRWRHKSGELRDILLSYSPVAPNDHAQGVVFTAQDITERRKTETALRESAIRHRLVIETAAEGFWMLNLDRETIEVNAALCRMLGYTRQEMLGRHPAEFTDEINRHIFQEQMSRIETTPHRQYEVELRRKDGSPIPLFFQATTYFENGVPQLCFAFVTDLREHQRMESALRRELQRSKDYLDTVEVILLALDRHGRITLLNRKGCELLGCEADELLGLSWFEHCLPMPEAMEQSYPMFQRLMAGRIEEGEYFENHIYTRDGRRRLIAWHNSLLYDESGQICGCLGAGEDITEQRQLERELRESSTRFRRLVQSTPVPMCHVSRAGDITYINDRFSKIFGWTIEDIPTMAECWPKTFPDPVHRDRVISAWNSAVKQAARDRSDISAGEFIVTCKNGTLRHVEVAGILLNDGMLLTFTDLTARRRAEEESRRLYMAVEQSSSSVIITDTDGIIQYVNQAFERVSGYDRSEILGKTPHLLKLTSERQDSAFYRNLVQTVSCGNTWEGRLVNRRKDGTFYTDEGSISPVRDSDGKIINFVAVLHDISKELHLQAEQEHLRDQLHQAQKLESVGRLAGGVAHDFNNKLGVILGYVDIALMCQATEEKWRRSLEEIRSAAEQSVALTRQLLTFARRQAINPKVLDLNKTVASMLKILRRLIGEDIKLTWSPGADLWPLLLDPAQVDQILANLAVNARDAIGGVGKVRIETANISIDAEYSATLPDAEPGDYVQLTVSDTGCGISPQVMRHIFEPFFTTKAVGEGTGLGLATIFGIVKQNKGFINVHSEPDKGSSFKIYLPRHLGDPQEEEGSEEMLPAAGGSETVLLVEDEIAMLDLSKNMLEELGYTVLASNSPTEAVRLVQEHPGGIDLLIADVVMPEMNGRHLADQILTLRPDIRYLFVSGYTADVIAERGVLNEGIQFLQKPFSRVTLARKIREILAL
ncbi:MAG: hypothetical protein BWK76_06435 [Desulfobulbaceae bacterium A2]|nr:MAG: hypothetical protein BWK76_06435 [Desulfobulbaceae bacterium A2]